MNIKRLNEIFQLRTCVPVIAGMYIGMDETQAAERLDELAYFKEEHSYDYPADLIYSQNISFEYDLFDRDALVRSIRVIFPRELSKNDYLLIKEYLSEKFYHEKIREDVESTINGKLLNGNVVLTNYYYQYAMINKDGKFIIQITGLVPYPCLYRSFYLVATQPDLMNAVENSLAFCTSSANKDEFLDVLFPVHNGYPIVCKIFLGKYVESSTEAENKIDDVIHDPDMYYQYQEYRDISFEVMVGEDNRVYQIFMRMIQEDKDVALKILEHYRERLLIESASYRISYNEDGEMDIKVTMANDFLRVTVETSSELNRNDIVFCIEAVKEDGGEIYRALYDMLDVNTHYNLFFKPAMEFYKDGSCTQDAKFNDLRREYDSFEDAVESFIAWHEGFAHDMGGYTKHEEEVDRGRFLYMWNTPDVEMPTIW